MIVSFLLLSQRRPINILPSICQGIHVNFCADMKRPIEILEDDLVEAFVRGSGPGGQKINKSKNNVYLMHKPTGISVQCQDARDLFTNRKIARKLLKDKIDLDVNGNESKLGKKFERIRKQKKNAARYVKFISLLTDKSLFETTIFINGFVIMQTGKQEIQIPRLHFSWSHRESRN